MTHARIHCLVMIGIAATAMPAFAQQAADPAKTSAAAAPASTPASTPAPAAAPAASAAPAAAQQSSKSTKPEGPSGETLVMARKAGYHTRVRHGVVLFCKEEAQLGTRFTEEHCLNEDQLALSMERAQAQRDQLTNRTCTGCSGK